MPKYLLTATVVKTHVAQFHLPCLKMLKSMGWETAVAAKNDYANPADCVIPGCDRFYPIDFARNPLKPANFKAYRRLQKIIEEEHFDVIHCHTPVAAILTRLAARKARKQGCKVLYTAHGLHFFKGAPLVNWLLYFPAEWVCAFFTDVLITINQEDYAFAQKHLHAKSVRYVRGVGVDLEKFQDHSAERAAVRASLGLRDEDFMLLSVAEMTKNKNHKMMLEALAQLPDPSIRLVCVGQGQELENNRALCSRLGLSDRVQFLGYRKDVPLLYAAADAFLFVSFREGLSLSLMEAMSSRLPSIVTPIRGNTDLITGGKEGLYTQLDPASIAAAIGTLRNDPALCRSLGQAAGEKIQAFGLKNVLEDMRKIYLDVVS